MCWRRFSWNSIAGCYHILQSQNTHLLKEIFEYPIITSKGGINWTQDRFDSFKFFWWDFLQSNVYWMKVGAHSRQNFSISAQFYFNEMKTKYLKNSKIYWNGNNASYLMNEKHNIYEISQVTSMTQNVSDEKYFSIGNTPNFNDLYLCRCWKSLGSMWKIYEN